MTSHAALPFTLRRTKEVVGDEIVSTRETTHGLLRWGDEGLRIQWRVSRTTDRVGHEIRSDRDIEPVREVVVPPEAIAGATVRWLWWRWPPGRYLILTASDFRAFEELAGLSALGLDHPAELVLRIGRQGLLDAREFAVEIELAVADRAIRAADRGARLPDGGEVDRREGG